MQIARERALLSGGASDYPIYQMVARLLSAPCVGGTLVDVGCGAGRLRAFLDGKFSSYIGVDLVHYAHLPAETLFVQADLSAGVVPLRSDTADLVVSIETIEHLENPRSFMRELARIARPGGTIAVSTPNQLSLLSKLGLLLKNEFPAFQEAPGLYPAHLTALLDVDLVRMARECELQDPRIVYSDNGRVPGISKHWPSWCRGRAFSDNIILVAKKPMRKTFKASGPRSAFSAR
jgi:SAM-dependent methyltransferase